MFLEQGQFQLFIVINNTRENEIELVDNFNLERMLSPSTNFTPTNMIDGDHGRGEFKLSYRIQCALNYYGPDCNTLCVPTNRFMCDSNGNIVCNEGYQNKENDCSDCVLASGCGKEV